MNQKYELSPKKFMQKKLKKKEYPNSNKNCLNNRKLVKKLQSIFKLPIIADLRKKFKYIFNKH